VKRIGGLRTTEAVSKSQWTLWQNSPTFVTPMPNTLRSFETSVRTIATRRNIPEDGILQKWNEFYNLLFILHIFFKCLLRFFIFWAICYEIISMLVCLLCCISPRSLWFSRQCILRTWAHIAHTGCTSSRLHKPVVIHWQTVRCRHCACWIAPKNYLASWSLPLRSYRRAVSGLPALCATRVKLRSVSTTDWCVLMLHRVALVRTDVSEVT
jgi:hypothetical protein